MQRNVMPGGTAGPAQEAEEQGGARVLFGARGSGSFFSRATAVLATAFFATSLTLAYLSSQHSTQTESLLETEPVVEEQAEDAPLLSDDVPATGMPELEPTHNDGELPALEEEPTEDSSSEQ